MSEILPQVHFTVVPGLSRIAQADWDRLLAEGDAPLLSWAYLQGLEEAGCVGPETSWTPAPLCALDRDGALLGAAPAYIKTNSDGEWVYDLDWAEASGRMQRPYYPKLVLAVPFNPVTGRRVLCRPDLPEPQRRALCVALLRVAQQLCEQAHISSVHVLFPDVDQLDLCVQAGYARRTQEQYHFKNPGYRDFDAFLADLTGHRRSTIRRERRALREAGITVTTRAGLRPPGAGEEDGFTLEELDQVFDMYVDTSVRYTAGPPYLNRRFFHLCAERLGQRLELVLARDRDGFLIGGAFNLRADRRLYGRYWGQATHVPFLHFEVCFYHSIERCIALGLEAFEPGHGGEQKLLRGFQPVPTYSAHHLRERRLRGRIEHYLRLEAPYVEASMAEARRRCPIKALRPHMAGGAPPDDHEGGDEDIDEGTNEGAGADGAAGPAAPRPAEEKPDETRALRGRRV
jgi:hypothetical protein